METALGYTYSSSIVFSTTEEEVQMRVSSEKGQGLVEYALLTVLIVAIIVAAVTPLRNAITNAFNVATNVVNNAGNQAQG